jgi:hypothetical protein
VISLQALEGRKEDVWSAPRTYLFNMNDMVLEAISNIPYNLASETAFCCFKTGFRTPV